MEVPRSPVVPFSKFLATRPLLLLLGIDVLKWNKPWNGRFRALCALTENHVVTFFVFLFVGEFQKILQRTRGQGETAKQSAVAMSENDIEDGAVSVTRRRRISRVSQPKSICRSPRLLWRHHGAQNKPVQRSAHRLLRPAHHGHTRFLDYAHPAGQGQGLARPAAAWRQDQKDVAVRSSVELLSLTANDVVNTKRRSQSGNAILIDRLRVRRQGKRLTFLIIYKHRHSGFNYIWLQLVGNPYMFCFKLACA